MPKAFLIRKNISAKELYLSSQWRPVTPPPSPDDEDDKDQPLNLSTSTTSSKQQNQATSAAPSNLSLDVLVSHRVPVIRSNAHTSLSSTPLSCTSTGKRVLDAYQVPLVDQSSSLLHQTLVREPARKSSPVASSSGLPGHHQYHHVNHIPTDILSGRLIDLSRTSNSSSSPRALSSSPSASSSSSIPTGQPLSLHIDSFHNHNSNSSFQDSSSHTSSSSPDLLLHHSSRRHSVGSNEPSSPTPAPPSVHILAQRLGKKSSFNHL